MKKKILIISGGISKERLISLNTGNQVKNELIKNKYRVKIAEPNFELLNVIKSFKPNIIFNALHGQFGEDGYIQTILETTWIFLILIQVFLHRLLQWIKNYQKRFLLRTIY